MPRPFAELSAEALFRVRAVASDIDDTMTVHGVLPPMVLDAVRALDDAGVAVLLVTGRPAGLLAGLVTYLPGIECGIAENGGAVVERSGVRATAEDSAGLTRRLAECEREVLERVPDARPTGDRYARLSDVTFHVDGLSAAGRTALDAIAAGHGLATIASSIHVHVLEPGVSKGRTLEAVAAERGFDAKGGEVLTAGDSLTDGPLFDPARFPISVGVANVRPYLDRIAHPPAYVTDESEGHGFVRVARALLLAKGAA